MLTCIISSPTYIALTQSTRRSLQLASLWQTTRVSRSLNFVSGTGGCKMTACSQYVLVLQYKVPVDTKLGNQTYAAGVGVRPLRGRPQWLTGPVGRAARGLSR